MKTLWNAADRAEVQRRAHTLAPDATAAWGKMNVREMVAHVADQLRLTLGRLHPARIPGYTHLPGVKQLVIFWAPWPKGAPTIPELRERAPGVWGTEIEDLVQLVEDFGRRSPNEPWPLHPMFGTLSPAAWGRLGYRHLDHHFRQFRV